MYGPKEILVRWCLVLGLAMLFMMAMVPAAVAGQSGPAKSGNQGNPGVIPPQAKYGGMTYGEWSAAWWQWAFSMPVDHHPLFDLTGEDAANGQSGHVWFLGGLWWANDAPPPSTAVTREIIIPSGKALFFPIVNSELNCVELAGTECCPPEGVPNVQCIRDLMASFIESLTNDNMYATIDRKPFTNVVAYRAISQEFSMWLPENNALEAWGIPFEFGEITPVVADGYFLMVAPLSVGKHTITFGVKNLEWFMDITYNITVVPGKRQ